MFRRLAQLEHQDRSQDPEYRLLQQQKFEEQHQQQQLMEQQLAEQQRLFLEQAALEQARQAEARRLLATEAATAPIRQMEQRRMQQQKQLLIDQEARLKAASDAKAKAEASTANRIITEHDEQGAWNIALEPERVLQQEALPLNPFSRDPMLAIDKQIDRISATMSLERGHVPTTTKPRTVDRAFGDGFFLDRYDFCAELLLTTPKPLKGGWPLECLQLEFIKVGGKAEGLLYPSVQSQAFYNSCLTWKEVLDKLQRLILCAKGIRCSEEQQQEAIQGLIGVMGDPKRLHVMPGAELFLWNGKELVDYRLEERIPSFQGGSITGLFAITDLRPSHSADISCNLVASDQQYIGVSFNGSDNFGITKDLGKVHLKLRCSAQNINLAKVIWLPAGEERGTFSCTLGAPCSLAKLYEAPILSYEVGIVNQRNTFVEQRFSEQPFLQPLEHGLTFKNKTVDKLVTPGKNGYVQLQGSAYLGIDQIHFRVWRQFTFLFRIDTISLGTNQILTVLGLDEKLQGAGFWLLAKRLDHTKAELFLQQSIDRRVITTKGSIPISLAEWHIGVVSQLDVRRWSFTVDTLDLEKALFITNVNRPIVTYDAKKHDLIWGADRNSGEFNMGLAWIHFFDRPLDPKSFEKECKYLW